MSVEPTIPQWITAFGLMGVFSWVLLGMFWNLVPTPWNQSGGLEKKLIAMGMTLLVGSLSLFLTRPVLSWVWLGLKHVLGLDMEGM